MCVILKTHWTNGVHVIGVAWLLQRCCPEHVIIRCCCCCCCQAIYSFYAHSRFVCLFVYCYCYHHMYVCEPSTFSDCTATIGTASTFLTVVRFSGSCLCKCVDHPSVSAAWNLLTVLNDTTLPPSLVMTTGWLCRLVQLVSTVYCCTNVTSQLNCYLRCTNRRGTVQYDTKCLLFAAEWKIKRLKIKLISSEDGILLRVNIMTVTQTYKRLVHRWYSEDCLHLSAIICTLRDVGITTSPRSLVVVWIVRYGA